jgi:hypothetical protein
VGILVLCKSNTKIKELQANNPDVDYVFISMDKTADKWLTGIDKHELKGDHFMANDQQQGVFGTIDLDWIQDTSSWIKLVKLFYIVR